jgi:hypothetical protein
MRMAIAVSPGLIVMIVLIPGDDGFKKFRKIFYQSGLKFNSGQSSGGTGNEGKNLTVRDSGALDEFLQTLCNIHHMITTSGLEGNIFKKSIHGFHYITRKRYFEDLLIQPEKRISRLQGLADCERKGNHQGFRYEQYNRGSHIESPHFLQSMTVLLNAVPLGVPGQSGGKFHLDTTDESSPDGGEKKGLLVFFKPQDHPFIFNEQSADILHAQPVYGIQPSPGMAVAGKKSIQGVVKPVIVGGGQINYRQMPAFRKFNTVSNQVIHAIGYPLDLANSVFGDEAIFL